MKVYPSIKIETKHSTMPRNTPIYRHKNTVTQHENGTYIESINNVRIKGKALCTDGKVRTFHMTDLCACEYCTCWNATVQANGKRVSGFIYLDGAALCKDTHTVRFDQYMERKNTAAIPHYMPYCCCDDCKAVHDKYCGEKPEHCTCKVYGALERKFSRNIAKGLAFSAEVSRKACNR